MESAKQLVSHVLGVIEQQLIPDTCLPYRTDGRVVAYRWAWQKHETCVLEAHFDSAQLKDCGSHLKLTLNPGQLSIRDEGVAVQVSEGPATLLTLNEQGYPTKGLDALLRSVIEVEYSI